MKKTDLTERDLEAISVAFRSPYNALDGYYINKHDYHKSNKGNNDNAYAPRLFSETPEGILIGKKRVQFDNWGKGSGYTVVSFCLYRSK